MKITDIVTSEQPGTYAAVTFSKKTVDQIKKFVEDNDIPNAVDDWHTTIVYSRKHLPNFKPIEKYDPIMKATVEGIELFDPDQSVLVMRLSCPSLYQRFHKIQLTHGATYDYDTYRPHITLATKLKKFDISKLPEYPHEIDIVGEYSEDLDAD